MPSVIATAGSASANSYCTVEEATAYHAARLSSPEWTAASADNKAVAVIMATRVLDQQFLWAEYQSTKEQALRWPRTGILDASELAFVPSDSIPSELKNATAELAWSLLKGDRTLDSDVEAQGLKSLTAGPVSLTFKDNVSAKVLPDSVFYMLPRWWGRLRSRNSGVVDLVRS